MLVLKTALLVANVSGRRQRPVRRHCHKRSAVIAALEPDGSRFVTLRMARQ